MYVSFPNITVLLILRLRGRLERQKAVEFKKMSRKEGAGK